MINVFSEIGKLKEVLLHRPNKELEYLTPDMLERLLFDDIPYIDIAKAEHDAFANLLTSKGVKVLYIEKLAAESLKEAEVKKHFINQFIIESGVHDKDMISALTEYLSSFDNEKLVEKAIAGILKDEVKLSSKSLSNMIETDYPFITDPMPNLLFTRDPFSTIGNGVSLHKMFTTVRNREVLLGEYVFKYHPTYKGTGLFYNRDYEANIEGGDVLVLNKNTLAIGVSQRTSSQAIEILAGNLLNKEDTSFNTILAFNIPNSRAFMHLDTVLTQIDFDKFVILSELKPLIKVYKITKNGKDLSVSEEKGTLEQVLSNNLGRSIELIACAGGHPLHAKREQWNDGANTLALAPGEVVVYNRNTITNKILEDKGIKVNTIPSSELSRGRGGPRCMSMPFVRENI